MTNNNIVSQDVQSNLLAVDTVKILLPKGSFKLNNTQYFRPNYIGLTRTATKQEKADGLYRPKVILQLLAGTCTIEFSLPKLVRGNNLEELTVTDFHDVIILLQTHLKDYGILVSEENLRWADLYRVDFGKNLDLTLIGPVPEILNMLNRCVGFGRHSIYQIQYLNGGQSLRLQNASTDLLLYDKLHAYEMAGMSEKLSIEKDNYCQKPLCKMLAASHKSILRIERRYTCRKAVRKLFTRYGVKMPKFKDICNPQIGQDIITKDWQALVNACIFPLQSQVSKQLRLMLDFLKMDQCKTLGPALSYVLLQTLLKEYSVKDLKNQFRPYVSTSTLNNWFGKMHNLACKKEQKPPILEEITRQITQWQPFCLSIDSHDEELL